ncbi:MAG: 30S ribosomal protein S16 [Candidatus Falkowbacteria bacterium]|nr:30S ribosomal protein S16 [Candidatus Falkowbacteria bacterium]
MLTIKLAKVGKTNKKVFRLIIAEKGRDPYGDVLEILGSYNQYAKQLQAKKERIQYWLDRGAQMTPSVNNLLISQEIIEGSKVKASKKGETSEKRKAQLNAKASKKKAAEAKPVEEVKEEALVEETATESAPEEVKE